MFNAHNIINFWSKIILFNDKLAICSVRTIFSLRVNNSAREAFIALLPNWEKMSVLWRLAATYRHMSILSIQSFTEQPNMSRSQQKHKQLKFFRGLTCVPLAAHSRQIEEQEEEEKKVAFVQSIVNVFVYLVINNHGKCLSLCCSLWNKIILCWRIAIYNSENMII